MKILKIFLILVLVVLIVGAALGVYVAFHARDILVEQIDKNLGVEAKVGAVRIALPSTVMIEDLAIGPSFSVKRLTVAPSILGFLKGEVVLNSVLIEKPRTIVTREKDGSMDYGIPLPAQAPQGAKAPEAPSAAAPAAQPAGIKRIYAESVKITDGEVLFIDRGVEDEGPFEARLTDFNLDIGRVSVLQPMRMNLKGEGRIVDKKDNPIARVTMNGEADIVRREGDLKVDLPEVQLVPFKAYYRTYLKRELSAGVLAAAGVFKAAQNDLSGDIHLELNNVAFSMPPEEGATIESQVRGLTEDTGLLAVQSIFASQGKAVFDVSFKTSLLNPRFENVKIKGSFLPSKIGEILSQPPEKTVEQYKEIGEQFEQLGEQFKKIFKGD